MRKKDNLKNPLRFGIGFVAIAGFEILPAFTLRCSSGVLGADGIRKKRLFEEIR
jgi:hypothetical protein